ncbi:hypothetical protein EDC04DRAFT_3147227 [Pisolithus marmoratus]|nr:hypothetical protein EDC04DRAFT_3147227 [Pisolithus marmoratus]
MAPGHIRKWLKSLPSAGELGGSHRSHRSGTTESDSLPGVAEPRLDEHTADRDLTDNIAKPDLVQTEVTVAASRSSGSNCSGRSEETDLLPAATEGTVIDNNLAANVAGSVPVQTEATVEAASSGLTRSLDPDKARDYKKNIKQFRVLVIGRANAGKTTLLQRVCNSTDQPEIFDGEGNKIDPTLVQGAMTRGYHEIERELVFHSNRGFVFHDSCGFEAGSEQQFDRVKEFVVEHAASTTIKKRIHVIWQVRYHERLLTKATCKSRYCIPMTDSHRTVTVAEQKFFDACDTGHVPVIVLLTKADALNLDAIQELEEAGVEMEGAQQQIAEKERELLEQWLTHIKGMLGRCKFPPRGYVLLKNMDQEGADCTALMQCTANNLDEGLQRLLISTQQSSIVLRIEYAVKVTLRDVFHFINMEGCHVNAKELECVLLSWLQNRVGDSYHILLDLS